MPDGASRRLVVVANRVPAPRSAGAPPSVGGLVAAVQPALAERGGIWFGWSGETSESASPPRTRLEGAVEYVTLDLTADELARYYEGFCNRTLWPLLHGLDTYASTRDGEYEVWRAVNARFASALLPLLQPGDLVWVHDYHCIPLGEALRALGWEGALGYFHHIPIPEREHWRRIPHAEAIAAAFAAYDLVGVQTERDAGRLRPNLAAGVEVHAFPIGVDSTGLRAVADAWDAEPLASLRRGRSVVLGLDRLDYTKGVPARLEAWGAALAADPELARQAVLVQWSALSREAIPEYQAERAAVEAAVADIEAAHPGLDAVVLDISVRPPGEVASALRYAEVCVVNSIADGMNLVAKEYVALQRPEAPGVLVLTDGCGAAEELADALIVPSGDTVALAAALRTALAMRSEERRRRWQALSAVVESGTASAWRSRFLDALVRLAGSNRG